MNKPLFTILASSILLTTQAVDFVVIKSKFNKDLITSIVEKMKKLPQSGIELNFNNEGEIERIKFLTENKLIVLEIEQKINKVHLLIQDLFNTGYITKISDHTTKVQQYKVSIGSFEESFEKSFEKVLENIKKREIPTELDFDDKFEIKTITLFDGNEKVELHMSNSP